MDLSYDETSSTVTYVYVDVFSAMDFDLFQRTYEYEQTPIAELSSFFLDGSQDSWRNPSIANINEEDVHLIVAERLVSGGGVSQIVARTMIPGNNQTGSVIVIEDGGGSPFPSTRPDVAGDSRLGFLNQSFVVTWQQDFFAGISARMRVVTPSGALGPVVTLDGMANNENTDVHISKSSGEPGVSRLNVVWRRRDLITDERSLRSAQLFPSGAISIPSYEIANFGSGPGNDISHLDVSDALDLSETTALQQPVHTIALSSRALGGQTVILFLTNDTVVAGGEFVLSEQTETNRPRIDHSLTTSATSFALSYSERNDTPSGFDYFVTTFDLVDVLDDNLMGIQERRISLGGTGGSGATFGGSRLASRFACGEYGNLRYSAGSSRPGAAGQDVIGTDFTIFPQPVPAAQYCQGTPNSSGDLGFITMTGDRDHLSPKLLRMSFLPPSVFGILIVGTQQDVFPNVGGSNAVLCVGGSLGRYDNSIFTSSAQGTAAVQTDGGMIPSPGGSIPTMVGQNLFFQAWHRDTFSGQPTFNLTNAVAITLN